MHFSKTREQWKILAKNASIVAQNDPWMKFGNRCVVFQLLLFIPNIVCLCFLLHQALTTLIKGFPKTMAQWLPDILPSIWNIFTQSADLYPFLCQYKRGLILYWKNGCPIKSLWLYDKTKCVPTPYHQTDRMKITQDTLCFYLASILLRCISHNSLVDYLAVELAALVNSGVICRTCNITVQQFLLWCTCNNGSIQQPYVQWEGTIISFQHKGSYRLAGYQLILKDVFYKGASWVSSYIGGCVL